MRIGKFIIEATPPVDGRSFAKGRQPQKQPAIIRTCAVLRHELLAYYYSTKVSFQIDFGQPKTYSKFRAWLQAIGEEHRRLITGSVTARIKGGLPQEVVDRCYETEELGGLRYERAANPRTDVLKYWVSFDGPYV